MLMVFEWITDLAFVQLEHGIRMYNARIWICKAWDLADCLMPTFELGSTGQARALPQSCSSLPWCWPVFWTHSSIYESEA